jgi:hypothetical protein
MVHLATIRIWVPATALACAVVIFAPKAGADTPMCDQIVEHPTTPTCTCICEDDSSFSGCPSGVTAGTAVPTPNQCPDMLQGRRVISGEEAVLVPDPTIANAPATGMIGQLMLNQTEAWDGNCGLGIADGTPVYREGPFLPCRAGADFPFPMQSRFARLFGLPYDMAVMLRPSTDNTQRTVDQGQTTPDTRA